MGRERKARGGYFDRNRPFPTSYIRVGNKRTRVVLFPTYWKMVFLEGVLSSSFLLLFRGRQSGTNWRRKGEDPAKKGERKGGQARSGLIPFADHHCWWLCPMPWRSSTYKKV